MAKFINEQLWEQHELVQEFLNEEKPSVRQYADAYFLRDTLGFNFSFDIVKTATLRKLFRPEKELYVNYVKRILNDQVNISMKELSESLKNEEELELNMDESDEIYCKDYNYAICTRPILDIIKCNKTRYHELNNITDHKEFYLAMTESELACLGW